MGIFRIEYSDADRGTTVLVRHVDNVAGVNAAWIEPLMFGWRRAIIELDQIRSLILVRLNDTLQRVAVINLQLATRVKIKVKFAITYMNRNVDAFLTKRMVICGYDSMDQIIVDSTLRRLHYQINLMRLALRLLGDPQCDTIGVTQASRPLLFLTEKHVTRSDSRHYKYSLEPSASSSRLSPSVTSQSKRGTVQ